MIARDKQSRCGSAGSSTLKMEATCSSETSVDFQPTTLRYIPEDKTVDLKRYWRVYINPIWISDRTEENYIITNFLFWFSLLWSVKIRGRDEATNLKIKDVIMCCLVTAVVQLGRDKEDSWMWSNGGIMIRRGKPNKLLQCHFSHHVTHMKSPDAQQSISILRVKNELNRICSTCDGKEKYVQYFGHEVWRRDNHWWEVNVKMNVGLQGMKWIQLAQDIVQWWRSLPTETQTDIPLTFLFWENRNIHNSVVNNFLLFFPQIYC
jgi:hypothetical protein